MVASTVVSGIEYSLATDSDSEEISRVLGETFAKRDPPAVAVGLTAAEFQEFVALLCGNAVAQGLTIVARGLVTGEIAGALLAEDSTSPFPAGMEHLSPKFDPIFDILGELESAYRSNPAGAQRKSAHLFLLGVAERFSGLGIGQQLVTQCIANAARKGYQVAITEATNRTSQHIFRKMEFVERARASYQDHRFQGKAFFSSISEHGGPILMDKLLAL